MSGWLSASDRVRLASQLVAEFENQFSTDQYNAILKQFGIATERSSNQLFHSLLEDADDDHIAELGRHFGLDVPEPPPTAQEVVDSAPVEMDIDAYAELVSAETALREVIRLGVPNWIEDLTEQEVERLKEKLAEEDKRRDGITVSQDLLDYTEMYQLEKTINKHWDPEVQKILDDKKRTDVYLNIIGDIRNTVGHSRPIYAAERLLLAGAARQIRNQLSIYRAKADGPHRHYPSIDSARDEGGRSGSPNGDGLQDVAKGSLLEIPRINVGDEIVFDLEATDPRGRPLHWVAHSVPYGQIVFPSSFAEATGNRVTITWKVTEADYGEFRKVQIALRNGGKYRRHKYWDDGAVFYYHVNPPLDA